MSTAQFYREHGASMRAGTAADHRERMQEAYEAVRDKWLAERRYAALVSAILGNWTAGNCVEFMAPLGRALIAEGHADLHRYLWTRTIKRQVDAFFRQYSYFRQRRSTFDQLLALDTAGFVETDPQSHDDHPRAAAFLLQRLVKALSQWRDELAAAGAVPTDPDRIEHSLRELKPPRIAVNRPCRDHSRRSAAQPPARSAALPES